MKENLSLLKDLIKPYTTKFTISISKNVHIDKLDDTVNQYNNTHDSTIKMKPAHVKPNIFSDFSVQKMRKILNLNLVTVLEYQSTKSFL